MDPRRSAFNLRNYLLGGEDWGPGLLNRVLSTARSFSSDPGPVMKDGWVIGGRPAPEGDSISEDDVLELCVYLRGFLDDWYGVLEEEKVALARWLAVHKTTDIDHLDGVSKRVRDKVETLLEEPSTEAAINDGLALCVYLKAWLGTHCEHSFRPIENLGGGTKQVQCDVCEFTAKWAGQFPLARCVVCGDEMDRLAEGRIRRTCSDACRQQKRRAS